MQNLKSDMTIAIIVSSCLLFFYALFLSIREMKIQKKFNNFALSSTKNTKTLLDGIFNIFNKILKKFSNITSKSKLFNYLSKKYDKYTLVNNSSIRAIDYITLKNLLLILSLITCIIFKLLQIFSINYVVIFIIAIFFYYLPDIILVMKKKDITSEIIDAIIIIENNLKKGFNINNSIREVKEEVNDTLKNELEKILFDLENGISLEKAFLRFDKRMNLSCTSYISNIINTLSLLDFSTNEIFSYLASHLTTKKTKNEKSITYLRGARIFYKITIIIPLFSTILLIIFKPEYFKMIIDSIPALLIFISLILLYLSYILIGKSLMRGE